MRNKALTLTILTAILCSGCFTHRYAVGEGAPRGTEVYKEWHHHFLWGLISQDDKLDVADVCPSGNAEIMDRHRFVDGLLGALTFGIWQPTTVTVRCADGSGEVEIEIDEKLARTIVTDPLFIHLVAEMAPERVPEVRTALERLEGTRDLAAVLD